MTTNGHQTHIYIGLAGEGDAIGQGGMIRRTAGDSGWQSIAKGLPENPQVRALAIHPDNPCRDLSRARRMGRTAVTTEGSTGRH